jgi:hypothetical protein
MRNVQCSLISAIALLEEEKLFAECVNGNGSVAVLGTIMNGIGGGCGGNGFIHTN